MDERIEELRGKLEAYETMLAHLRRDDDSALRALAEELESQAARVRAEIAALEPRE